MRWTSRFSAGDGGWRHSALTRAGLTGLRGARGALVAVLLGAAVAHPLRAQGSPNEEPPPDSAAGLRSAFESELAIDTAQAALTAAQRRSGQSMSEWLLESRLTMQLRGYGLAQEKLSGSQPRGMAGGGWMRFRTGRWRDHVVARAALYLSMRVVGDTAHGGTGILAPDQSNLVSLAVLNAEAYTGQQVFTLGRQDLNLPLVNKADTRMIPQTFQALMGRGHLVKYVDWVGGWLFKYKPRDSDRFIPMSQANPGVTASRGMAALGLRRAEGHRMTGGVFDYYVPDVHNLMYAEGSWFAEPAAGTQLKFGLQLVDQRSVGAGLSPGSPFSTRYLSTRIAGSRNRFVGALALSTTTSGGEVTSPYGLFPGHTSTMTTDFTRASESAWHLELSYDFGQAGAYGFTAFTGFTRGTGGRDVIAGTSLPDRSELEITLDYKPERGSFQDIWFRARLARTWQNGTAPDAYEFRLIGYYDVPLPWPPRPGERAPR